MFGRDPRIPLQQMLTPKLRYLGDEDNILSLESLKRIYYLVAQNLKLARERLGKDKKTYPSKLSKNDLVMLKIHAKEPFGPTYKGYYRIVSFRENQVEVYAPKMEENLIWSIFQMLNILCQQIA